MQCLDASTIVFYPGYECMNISNTEDFSTYCRCTESGKGSEHFIKTVLLNNADAEKVHSQLIDCLREKKIQVSKLIGMGFDGAVAFFG